jgi:hypothetical protein
MAQRLGFDSTRALDAWEEEIVIDRRSNPSYLPPLLVCPGTTNLPETTARTTWLPKNLNHETDG